jgi:hypothetical protein
LTNASAPASRPPGSPHLVTVEQLRAFMGLLPDWDEIAVGLDAIVLDRYDPEAFGWHHEGRRVGVRVASCTVDAARLLVLVQRLRAVTPP